MFDGTQREKVSGTRAGPDEVDSHENEAYASPATRRAHSQSTV